ncbi:MAG TPA: large conductance mechanosensitive channel protein MscL [Candidatus Limnocylindria bacterium]|nr:large conductance mechanosensitive channel protein MscL [Candidatus Limnocylindria bacterium]
MLKGFRDFVMRGNVIDLAVAVVIAGAFGAVITSFVGDILTPLLGIFGLPDFNELTFQVGDATVRYGAFLNALIAFLLVALAIYLVVVRPMERMKGEAAVETKVCTECTSDIPLAAKRCPFCTQPQFIA